MSENQSRAEGLAATQELDRKFSEKLASFTRETIESAFPGRPITPNDYIAIHGHITAGQDKIRLLILKHAARDCHGEYKGVERHVYVYLVGTNCKTYGRERSTTQQRLLVTHSVKIDLTLDELNAPEHPPETRTSSHFPTLEMSGRGDALIALILKGEGDIKPTLRIKERR